MAKLRREPFIYVTWLKNYLIGNDLCRWSIWHRIYYDYEKAHTDFKAVHHNMEHTSFRHEIQQRYIREGYTVYPEMDIKVYGQVARLFGRVDLVAIREDKNLIVEIKTGKPNPADKIQLMLYIWALPKTATRFKGASFDGLLIYKNHSMEIEISAIEVDEVFVKNFSQFTTDIMSSEPDRKYPSPRECKWCKIANCDEKMSSDIDEQDNSDYRSDFF